MIKRKKIITMCIIVLTIIIMTSCKQNNEEVKEKYDVSIKVTNNFGEKWIFTPDMPLWTYEFQYTGEKMYFYVDSYNFPKHTILSDFWLRPSDDSTCLFSTTIRKKNLEQKKYDGNFDYICEKGEYYFSATTESNQSLYNPEIIWKYRTIYLYVTVI